jgi:hypothetical protein
MGKYSNATLEFMEHIAGECVNAENLEERSAYDFRAQFINDLTKESSTQIKEDINVITLKNLLMDKFGIEWLEWYPEVLNKTLFGEDRNDILTNKIQAIRACLTTDTPWLDWHIFENVGKSFNHQMPDFGIIQPLSLGECAVTVELMYLLRPEEQFSEEVLSYIGSIAGNENYVYIPDELKIRLAQPYLDRFVHDVELQKEIRGLWGKVKDKKLLQAEYKEDNPLHRQIANLAILKQYFEENINA